MRRFGFIPVTVSTVICGGMVLRQIQWHAAVRHCGGECFLWFAFAAVGERYRRFHIAAVTVASCGSALRDCCLRFAIEAFTVFRFGFVPVTVACGGYSGMKRFGFEVENASFGSALRRLVIDTVGSALPRLLWRAAVRHGVIECLRFAIEAFTFFRFGFVTVTVACGGSA